MEKIGLLTRSWWSYLVKGILAIALGVLLLCWPDATVRVFILIIGIYALIEGVIDFILAIIVAGKEEPFGMILTKSLVSLLIGGVIVSRPGVALTVVMVIVALWLIISGFLQLIMAFEMPPLSGRSLVGVNGALSLIIGILILVIPFETVWALIILIAIVFIISGAWQIFLGFYSMAERKKLEKAV